MTFHDLRDFQDLMLRAYVRNLMFFATLPYHLAGDMRRVPQRSSAARQNRSVGGDRGSYLAEDPRWLR